MSEGQGLPPPLEGAREGPELYANNIHRYLPITLKPSKKYVTPLMSWGSGLGIYSGPRRVGVPKIAEILSLPAKKII